MLLCHRNPSCLWPVSFRTVPSQEAWTRSHSSAWVSSVIQGQSASTFIQWVRYISSMSFYSQQWCVAVSRGQKNLFYLNWYRGQLERHVDQLSSTLIPKMEMATFGLTQSLKISIGPTQKLSVPWIDIQPTADTSTPILLLFYPTYSILLSLLYSTNQDLQPPTDPAEPQCPEQRPQWHGHLPSQENDYVLH